MQHISVKYGSSVTEDAWNETRVGRPSFFTSIGQEVYWIVQFSQLKHLNKYVSFRDPLDVFNLLHAFTSSPHPFEEKLY